MSEVLRSADYAYLVADHHGIADGSPEEIIKESPPAAHQFIHGIADGPVPFRYPAGDYLEEL